MATALLAAFALVCAASASASAATTYSHLSQFGGTGIAGQPGLFHNTTAPQRMAVHQGSGKLFVVDRGNNRVQVFNPTEDGAEFAYQIDVPLPVGVAVDQSNGDLFVTNATTIRKFNPNSSVNPTAYSEDGSFTSPPVGAGTGQIGALRNGPDAMGAGGGIAVDPDTGEILVADVGRNLIQRFDSDGVYVSSFNGASGDRTAFVGIRDLATTSTGDIIVAERISNTRGRIDRFDSAGVLQATLSDNNNPVPNPSVGGLDRNWGITVGVNAADEVFVSSVSSTPLGPTAPASRVYQFENDLHVTNFTAPANFAGPLYGIVGGDDPARLYVLAANQLPGLFGAATPRVQVFRAAVPPTVTLGDPSDVQATQATFNGLVNPQDGPTSWRFDYRPVGAATWTPVPVPNGDAGDGTDGVVVHATPTGLEPNTDYEVRLLAFKGDVTVISADPPKTFRTLAVPPVVDTGTASFLGTTTATLTGGVNPRKAQTDYYFEYGPDDNYGEVAPADPVDVGAASTRVSVTQPIDGLEPATTYHFRIVSENEFGHQSVGDDLTFTTLARARGGLGSKRAYEMVTQLPIDGQIAISGDTIASEDGNGATYMSNETGPLFPTESPLPHKAFMSLRGDNGWTASPFDLPDPSTLHFVYDAALSADFSRALPITPLSFDSDDQNGVDDLYLRRPDGSLVWISRAEDALLPAPVDPEEEPTSAQIDTAPVLHAGLPRMSALSADGRTVVFSSQRRLLEADPNASGAAARLYKWTDDGTAHGKLSLVSVRPNESVPPGATLGGGYSERAVSRDGSRVFWRDGTTIYASVDGVSKTVGAGAYVGATADGGRVFYTAAGRLYSFDVDPETTHDIAGAAQAQDLPVVSENGQRVYFVATAALPSQPSPLGHRPVSASNNLYLVELNENGAPQRLRFIATLGTDEGFANSVYQRTVDVSPDGTVLAFGSAANLVGKPTGGSLQLYVYDSNAHSLRCGSCPADGSVPAPGPVNQSVSPGGADLASVSWSSEHGYTRMVSADGTVFFDTRTALSPDDQNAVRDVYEYRSGEVRLVSRGGEGDAAATFEAAGVSGETMFFLSYPALVPDDYEDGARKVYAARVGGGFEYRVPEPGCTGAACQGERLPVPELDVPSSERFGGAGNVDDPRRAAARVSLAAIGRKQATVLARGRRATLRASVPVAGGVVVELRARLRRGGPVKVVGRARVRARKAGKVSLRAPKLQRKALSALRRQGVLGLRVVIRQGRLTAERRLRLVRPASRSATVNASSIGR